MTQIFETHLHFTAGIHGEVGNWEIEIFLKRMSQPFDAVKLVIPIAVAKICMKAWKHEIETGGKYGHVVVTKDWQNENNKREACNISR